MTASYDERPEDPSQVWTPATGPDGDVWVDRDDDGDGTWSVWDPDGGFRSVDADEFEAEYQLDIGPTTLDQDDS